MSGSTKEKIRSGQLAQDVSEKLKLEKKNKKQKEWRKYYHEKRKNNPEYKIKKKKYMTNYYKINRNQILEYSAMYREKNKNELKGYWIEYSTKLKIDVLTHYGKNGIPQCICCSEKNIKFLTIDHIYGRKNKDK